MRPQWIPLSKPRRLVNDLLYFAAGVPTVPVQRRMDVRALAEARSALDERPSWTAIFIKAYARVSTEVPELRRAYVKWPWAHLVEYPSPVASVAVERDYEGESAVLFGRVKDPGETPLLELTRRLRTFAEAPVGEVKEFRRALRTSRLPWPVRRLAWWVGLNSAKQRGHHFGTFGVSVYSALGAESLHPLSPLTTLLNYGVIGPDGRVDVRVVYDHRALDGATVARALGRLDGVLNGPILEEVRRLRTPAPAWTGEPRAAA
ncbi:MAG TPA: hypothetical protein VKE40_19635 [Gemmataceae bacterium]|nr:hypothetical protein [Gemmataceae bacterium]